MVLPGFVYDQDPVNPRFAVSGYGPRIESVLSRLGVPVAEHAALFRLYGIRG